MDLRLQGSSIGLRREDDHVHPTLSEVLMETGKTPPGRAIHI
jgi:hypothetical protein